MKKQIRIGVFETNSSTQHTLTVRANWLGEDTGKIPTDEIFEFSNVLIESFEGDGDVFNFETEQEKLALCVAYCMNAYENLRSKQTDDYWWDYQDEADDNHCSINDVLKNKPYFVDLYAAIKEERNTELVLTDGIYRLDSLNDDMAFEHIFWEFENVEEQNNSLKDFFKYLLFDNVYIEDEMLGM